MNPAFQRAGVLPGYVLDKVIDGDVTSRFAAAVRIVNFVWEVGDRACATEDEVSQWRARHLAYMRARLEVMSAHAPV